MRRVVRLAAAACLVAAPGHAALVLQRTIVSPAGARGDLFGVAVAAGGGAVVVGASGGDGTVLDSGAAWQVDPWSGDVRTLVPAASLGAGARFGHAVAAAAGSVAVSAPQLASPGARAGAVLLFDAGGGPRGAVAVDPGAGAQLGAALALDAGRLVVGAPFAAEAEGVVHLLEPATGASVRTLESPDPAQYDLFGAAVAAGGDRIVVGEPLDDEGAANAGAVHVFDAAGTFLWTLRSPDPSAGDLFGTAVAIVGPDVLVGAPFDDGAAADGGAAYLFDGATGALRRRFDDPAPRRDGRFGVSVAARGADLLVAAPFVDGGVVHLLDALGQRLDTLVAPNAEVGDQFGMALASDGDLIVVGAWLAEAGAVYVYRDPSAPRPTSTTTTTSTTSSTTSSSVPPGVVTTTTAPFVGSTTTTTSPAPLETSTSSSVVAATSSSTTTTTPGSALPPTTTTTLPGEALPCDDGDRCTLDVSEGGRCGSMPMPGIAGARCRVAMLAALLAEVPDESAGGRRVRARLRHRVEAADRLLEESRVPRGRRELRRVVVAITRATRRGRTLPAVAEAIRALATDAITRLNEASLPR